MFLLKMQITEYIQNDLPHIWNVKRHKEWAENLQRTVHVLVGFKDPVLRVFVGFDQPALRDCKVYY